MRTGPRARVVAAAALLAAATTATGCGSTTINTNVRNARIYVDGREVGRGSAEVRQRGLPGSATIVVRAPDGRETTKRMKRHFTLTTALLGLFTYGVGLVTFWEYPDEVFVPLQDRAAAGSKSSWDSSAGDVWMKPPPGWKPKQRQPSPQPSPNAAAPAGNSGAWQPKSSPPADAAPAKSSSSQQSPWNRPPR